jgi:hypothetical protein
VSGEHHVPAASPSEARSSGLHWKNGVYLLRVDFPDYTVEVTTCLHMLYHTSRDTDTQILAGTGDNTDCGP